MSRSLSLVAFIRGCRRRLTTRVGTSDGQWGADISIQVGSEEDEHSIGGGLAEKVQCIMATIRFHKWIALFVSHNPVLCSPA